MNKRRERVIPIKNLICSKMYYNIEEVNMEDHKKVFLGVFIEKKLLDKIVELAQTTNRSKSGMVITILKDWFKDKTDKWEN